MFLRLTRVLAVAVALPILALAPAFVASYFFGQIPSVDDETVQLTTVVEPNREHGKTVMLNASITNRAPTHLSWYSPDIIRNGVLIREDFVRSGDVLSAGPIDAPI